MSNIEDDVKAAIDEFGECAFERFEDNLSFDYSSNSEIHEHILDIQLKTLPELLAHDMRFYVNAFELWEKKENNNDEYYTFSSNNHLNDYICIINNDGYGSGFGEFHVRRKTSAALPFDLEGAKAGDVVEWIAADDTIHSVKFIENFDEWRSLIEWSKNNRDLVATDKLRMRFPKKVQL